MGKRRWRRLIILRGLPGSGKTIKAEALLDQYGSGVIVSADDYFRNGPNGEIVNFDPRKLQIAHEEAQDKALAAMSRKENPVIIDNINIRFWEMYPYVVMGFHRGYFIEFVTLMDYSIDELYGFNRRRIRYEKLEEWESSYRPVKHIYKILFDREARLRWAEERWGKGW